jgi:ribosomal protein S18 acetylase RimI-like enzyme
MPGPALAVLHLGPEAEDDVVDVLTASFAGYPVMDFVLGAEGGAADLRALVGFFVAARLLRREPTLGVPTERGLAAAALVSFPVHRPPPRALALRREALWAHLGPEARARYESCGAVWSGLMPRGRYVHLNMLGVASAHRCQGLARLLLDEVHTLAEDVPGCEGVTLTTEEPANVPLYEHAGYRVVATRSIIPGLPTWVMARISRPRPAARARTRRRR